MLEKNLAWVCSLAELKIHPATRPLKHPRHHLGEPQAGHTPLLVRDLLH